METLVVVDSKMAQRHGRDNVTTYVLTVLNMVGAPFRPPPRRSPGCRARPRVARAPALLAVGPFALPALRPRGPPSPPQTAPEGGGSPREPGRGLGGSGSPLTRNRGDDAGTPWPVRLLKCDLRGRHRKARPSGMLSLSTESAKSEKPRLPSRVRRPVPHIMRTTDERRDRGTRASRSTGSRVTDACFDSSLGDAVGTALACFPLKAVSVLASRPVACAAGRTPHAPHPADDASVPVPLAARGGRTAASPEQGTRRHRQDVGDRDTAARVRLA